MKFGRTFQAMLAILAMATLVINSGTVVRAGTCRAFVGKHGHGGGHLPGGIATNYLFTTIVGIPSYGFGPSAFGINDEGVASGFYPDSSGFIHGFLARDGLAVTVNAPGDWADTYLGGINDSGVVVGNYDDDLTVSHATLYKPLDDRWIELPDIPGIPLNYGNGINNFGFVVGAAYEGTPTDYTNGVGWLWDGRSYSFIEVPGSSGTDYGTYAAGINDEGVVVGYYQDSAGVIHGFLKRGPTLTTLDVPGADNTLAVGINDEGDVVGVYYLGAVSYGFIQHAGDFVTVDVPGAASTQIYGINNLGQISGSYLDTAGNWYGFTGTPVRQRP